MAEIYRVGVLLVTLLAYLFWLPPDTRGGSFTTDSGDAVNDRNIIPEAADGDGPVLRLRTNPRGPHRKGGTSSKTYKLSELRIVELLTVYFDSGCKAASEVAKPYMELGHGKDPGNGGRVSGRRGGGHFDESEKRLATLLSSYFSSNCKVHSGVDAKGGNYSTGVERIIGILKTLFDQGCNAGKAVAQGARNIPGAQYSRGEILTLNLLSSYFAVDCKGSDIFKSVSGNETLRSSGCRVQFFVLELFLPIAGVYLTQANL